MNVSPDYNWQLGQNEPVSFFYYICIEDPNSNKIDTEL